MHLVHSIVSRIYDLVYSSRCSLQPLAAFLPSQCGPASCSMVLPLKQSRLCRSPAFQQSCLCSSPVSRSNLAFAAVLRLQQSCSWRRGSPKIFLGPARVSQGSPASCSARATCSYPASSSSPACAALAVLTVDLSLQHSPFLLLFCLCGFVPA